MVIIKNGRLIDPKTGFDEQRDIVLDGARIAHIGKFSDSSKYGQVIDANGMVVAPGLIDLHVHFREPGLTHKEDIHTGALAAAKGGFTTVVCMANTKPVIDNEETLKHVLDAAAKEDIHVLTVAAISKGIGGKELTDMEALLRLGAAGFSDDGISMTDAGILRKAMLNAKALGVPISLHEEDPVLIGTAGINEGEVSAKLDVGGAPWVSEASMVARDCMLALETGAKVHIQHVSCAASVAAVRLAKKLGANVTAEVTPQHLCFTQEMVMEKGSLAKLNPPLRTEKDRQNLIRGLAEGVIDVIATDHAPHSAQEKAQPIALAPSGVTGLETALAAGITCLVRRGYLTLSDLLAKMTASPAKVYSLESGQLAEGSAADIVIFDENQRWTVTDFASKSSNSPFIGQELYGKVKYTICGGKVVYKDQP